MYNTLLFISGYDDYIYSLSSEYNKFIPIQPKRIQIFVYSFPNTIWGNFERIFVLLYSIRIDSTSINRLTPSQPVRFLQEGNIFVIKEIRRENCASFMRLPSAVYLYWISRAIKEFLYENVQSRQDLQVAV